MQEDTPLARTTITVKQYSLLVGGFQCHLSEMRHLFASLQVLFDLQILSSESTTIRLS